MLEISLDSPVPLGDQLVAGFRHLIASGTLKPGDELPPVRQVAADLGINLNTVARAYRQLESGGLVSTARGRGTRITAAREQQGPAAGNAPASAATSFTAPPSIAANAALRDAVSRVLTDAKLAGFTADNVRASIERLIPHYWPTGDTP